MVNIPARVRMSSPLVIRVKRVLVLRPLPIVLAIMAVLLAMPAVWTGWQQDDLVQRFFLLGNAGPHGERQSAVDLFEFLDGSPTRNQDLMDAGVLPWWTLPTLRLSFWRPLSALSHWLDYLLWPQSGPLMHLQSLLWFAALVVAATLLYRRIIGAAWVAGLAALFFALDDAHGLAAGWLANRNALIAGLFGVLALISHHRWRQEAWKPGAVLGPGLLLLALLGGESALAVCGYLFAYALFMESGDWRARVASLIPAAVVTTVWLVWYALRGYGTSGSGFYVDPLSEPRQFLAAVAWKAPVLLADQWALPPSSIVLFVPDQYRVFLVVWALAVLGLIAVFLVPLLRFSRTARFWAAGMILSIPLVCSTMPHGRLLLFAGIGAFGLLAHWLEGVWSGAEWVPANRLWRGGARAVAVGFLVVHIVLAAASLPLNATSATFAQRYIQDPALRLSAAEEFRGQDLVILNHPVPFLAHYFQTARVLAGFPAPARVRVLAPGVVPLRIQRFDDRTLVIRPEGGFLVSPFDRVFRSASYPMQVGQSVALEGMTVEIMEVTVDGRPAQAAFRFSRPLEDTSLRWVQWEGVGYVPFELPGVGEVREIPAAGGLF